MVKHILGQGVYQLAVMTWLLTQAPQALGIPPHLHGDVSVHYTLVFNAFVLMQLFNQVNSRQIQDTGVVWTGLGRARLFQVVLASELALQVAIVQWGGAAFSTQPISIGQWFLCAGFGTGSLALRELLRRLPLETWWSSRNS